jgi:hypothetical protein
MAFMGGLLGKHNIIVRMCVARVKAGWRGVSIRRSLRFQEQKKTIWCWAVAKNALFSPPALVLAGAPARGADNPGLDAGAGAG